MEKTNNRISVLMSVYNNEDTVKKAIESIVKQTHSNLQFVIVNDGSTDKSLRIITKYAKKDECIKVLSYEKNLGLARALNYGLIHCEGEYIARQDADDWSNIARLALQLKYMKESNLDFVGCNVALHNRGLKNPEVIDENILRGNRFVHGTILFKKEIIQNVGSYNPYFRYSQDYELYLRIYKAGYKMGNMQNFLYYMGEGKRVSDKQMYKQSLYRTFAKLINIDEISGFDLVSDLGMYLMYRWKKRILGR